MNSDEVFHLIEQIAGTPGKNDKIALVTKNIEDPLFQKVLVAAYDPLTTYGVRKFLSPKFSAISQFDDITWSLIEKLASRELSGNAALGAIQDEMERLTASSCELLKRILLKDMRAGFDAETCNKAKSGLVKDFPYMRCSLPKHVKDMDAFFADGAFSQEKADGQYLNIDVRESGEVIFRTRQGNEYPSNAFAKLEADILELIDVGSQLHGEMLVLRDGKVCERADGNGVLNHIQAGGDFAENEEPLFLVWDQISLELAVPKGKDETPYIARLSSLVDQVLHTGGEPLPLRMTKPARCRHLSIVPTVWVKDMEQAIAHYKEMLQAGKEGTVLKKAKAIWKDGTSREQVKLKLKAPFEARVKGFNLGTGKNTGKISSLQCKSECGKLEFSVSCRGEAMIAQVTADPESWQDSIVTVEGNGIMAPSDSNPLHSIFLPIFVERRTDKSEADTLERIQDQFKAAINA